MKFSLRIFLVGLSPFAFAAVALAASGSRSESISSAPAVLAESSAASPTATLNSSSSIGSGSIIGDIQAPKVGDFTIHTGIKSQNTAGRPVEYDNPKGRRYFLKNEYYLGTTHASGWGLSAMAVTTGSVYADDSRNNVGAGDPSVTLIHPVLYKDRDMTISGQFRRYFPVSDWASNRNQQQYAYYMFTTYAFGHGVNAFNQLTPRFFQQSYYKPSDTHFMTEDYTTLTKQVASWFKYGLGQHTQIEWHDQTSMGQTVEVYPLADLVFSKNISVEPRYYLPVYSMNRVYDAPKSVSLGDSRAEIYMQITI